jgi:putative transposase
MARMARVVVPFYPHHVTWRGNRRRRTFFGDDDYSTYVELMAEFCRKAGTRVWAYWLMPNHAPGHGASHVDGLRAALGEAHRHVGRNSAACPRRTPRTAAHRYLARTGRVPAP